ncbi:MAG: exodeoxyribonuclease VII small subunit [Bacilli bacterium]|jgi:exodeoxyribonuclease VII small subunit|nr:exodeoxyribonuclease VII small subunit [Bacilli bacterium]MCH4210489.1 exodeoxyribonuclease VII small subunit [Bacilli bacterium]MCH4228287.1 exodeoxyribonuclease VII small subunit [Bacilli bacterium]MCH4277364.1 exodeoxyribonuclease VII small subunit [Bacilli bacterium]MCI2054708.1 exodeoxyribonuclease VII small subunit [Bacilli bacterium]
MTEKKEKSFEEKLARLNEIVEKVENETLPLETSIKLFEEGKGLISELESTLKDAEKKIGKYNEIKNDK